MEVLSEDLWPFITQIDLRYVFVTDVGPALNDLADPDVILINFIENIVDVSTPTTNVFIN